MIKIHTRLFKRLLALGFMCFIANQALAYEKSGFFVGIQGSKTNYKVVEKIDSAHSIVGTQIFSEGHLAGVSCETKTSTSSKWGGLVDKTTVTTTCKPGSSDVVLDGNSSTTLLMDTITNFVNSNTRLRVFNSLKRLSFQVFVSKICTHNQRLLKKAKIQQNAFCPKNLQIKDKFKI